MSSRRHTSVTQVLYTTGSPARLCTRHQEETKKHKKRLKQYPPYQELMNLRTRWQTACHPCLKQRTRGNMLFDPTERNVNPFPFQARVRPMKELILTLAIHDKNITMAKPAKVSFIVQTGLTPPSEQCRAAKTHGNNELGITTLSKQRFVIAMPTHTRIPSPVKVQVRSGWHISLSTPWLIRGTIVLHNLMSSGQHCFPVCGLKAGPRPYAYEQVHQESQGTAHAVWYDPLLSQSPAAEREERRFSLGGHHGTTIPQTLLFSPQVSSPACS